MILWLSICADPENLGEGGLRWVGFKVAGGDWSPLSSSVHGVTYQLLHRYVDSLWKEKSLGEKFYILMYIFVWDLIYAGLLLLKIFKFYTQFFEHCISLFLHKPVLIIFYAY